MIELQTAHLLVRVDEGRGAEITHVGRDADHNALFHDDWGAPLRASRSVTWGEPTLDWLSEYRGAWQELFPNAGDACEVMGTPLPFHGEVSAARWEVVERLEGAPREVQLELMSGVDALVEETTRWYLTWEPDSELEETIAAGRDGFERLAAVLGELGSDERRRRREQTCERLVAVGVPDALAHAHAVRPEQRFDTQQSAQYLRAIKALARLKTEHVARVLDV